MNIMILQKVEFLFSTHHHHSSMDGYKERVIPNGIITSNWLSNWIDPLPPPPHLTLKKRWWYQRKGIFTKRYLWVSEAVIAAIIFLRSTHLTFNVLYQVRKSVVWSVSVIKWSWKLKENLAFMQYCGICI